MTDISIDSPALARAVLALIGLGTLSALVGLLTPRTHARGRIEGVTVKTALTAYAIGAALLVLFNLAI